MKGLQFTCDTCGTRFEMPNLIGGNGSVYMEGNLVSCPVPDCGGLGHHKPGHYEFVDRVMRAFRDPGMTQARVGNARAIAAEAAKGSISSEEAIAQLREISATLAAAVEKSGGARINWEIILTLLMCIYTIWTDQKSDADAQAALAESQTQTEVAQKMLEESQAQTQSLRELVTRPSSPPQGQERTSASKNRAERRKAPVIERRNNRRSK